MMIDGRLRASYKDGEARFAAYLDDHAFLLDAVLELLQARWNSRHLEFACQLAELLLDHFEDKEHGGFWFTANDAERTVTFQRRASRGCAVCEADVQRIDARRHSMSQFDGGYATFDLPELG